MEQQDTNIERLLKARAAIDEKLRRHRRTLTVMFTDVAGTSAYFDRFRHRSAGSVRHRHANLAAAIVSEFRGSVVQAMDHALMAEFLDPDLAVHAAVNVQQRLSRRNISQAEPDRVLLRIGLHSGPCFRHGKGLYGDAVDVAARITLRSGPAQILISRSVRDSVSFDSGFRCSWLGQMSIPGRVEREDIFEVIWTEPGSYADMRVMASGEFSRGELMSPGVRPADLLRPGTNTSFITVSTPPSRRPAPSVFRPPPELNARYLLAGEIGSGATGIVFKARDRETGESVALKVLRPEFAADPQMLRRFKDELRLARKISHRNVCRIHEFNRAGQTAYISMELVAGDSLRQIVNRYGGLPVRDALTIALQICDGLREAHSQGIVHRDLKPENVMVNHAGDVKLMDFGVARAIGAKATLYSQVVGTPQYMAPEQVEAKPSDHRADIYSTGLVLYELFTGMPVFYAETPLAVAIMHVRDTPRPPRQLVPALPEAIEQAILKCLEKDPATRFASVDELQAALAQQPLEQPPAPEEVMEQPEMAASVAPAPPLPWGDNATHACVSEITGHAAAVYAVVFRPDGKLLASASEDRSIRLWEGAQGKEKTRLGCHAFSLAFHPNGKWLASGSGHKSARIWEVAGARELHSLAGHSKLVRGVAFSPDGAMLATASQDATIRIWDALSGKLLRTMSGHSGGVYAVAFSPDGQWLASGSTDKSVKLWDVKTGGESKTLSARAGGVYALAFSPDGRWLAAGTSEKKVKIWEVASARVYRTLSGHAGGVYAVAFSRDAYWLASGGGDACVKLWEVSTGRDLRTLGGHTGPVWSVAFSPDGRWLATASEDSTIRLW